MITGRVIRGGCFAYPAVYARSANRNGLAPFGRGDNIGFRVARSQPSGDNPAPVRNVSAGMILVEGGTFQMGNAGGENWEKPVHTVTVGSFFMGKHEVTQGEWVEIMGSSPGRFQGDTLPVESITWYEAVEYCNRLSVMEKLAPAYRGSGDKIICDFNASGYRLPTEAEWEYAARGGNKEGSMPGGTTLTKWAGTAGTAAALPAWWG
jgi:formylglycine-generating enzyme required for sulfatase activity